MNFFEAMQELEKGNKVRNANWKSTIYLYKENEDICFNNTSIANFLNIRDLNYGTWELYKETILDKTEKEYILNIIKPFKNKVCHIIKHKAFKEEYIQICVKSYNQYQNIILPTFVKGSMYKNMKLCHEYSLKELGLDE